MCFFFLLSVHGMLVKKKVVTPLWLCRTFTRLFVDARRVFGFEFIKNILGK